MIRTEGEYTCIPGLLQMRLAPLMHFLVPGRLRGIGQCALLRIWREQQYEGNIQATAHLQQCLIPWLLLLWPASHSCPDRSFDNRRARETRNDLRWGRIN